ncbi:hypothetical protein TNIN_478791 [Trichonephila inaurata madagascariensis]|uniref:Uncharacterized protein n=1 Tax=Trichonephila inaurata madagascariensis TaxID=2747483 RepID=A0A8X6WWG0_9ARAC|nr:hypothetical protein TNIN_478791 [Trichonephila inaurata madagascariensis]
MESQKDLSASETDSEDAEFTSDRQLRNRSLLQKSKRFENHIIEAESYLDDYNPETYKKNSKDGTNWKKAMQSKMNLLSENYTWELTDLPVGAKAIPLSEFIDSKPIQMAASTNIKPDLLRGASVNARVLITVKHTV